MTALSSSILWFKTITKDDLHTVGTTGVMLGDLLQSGFPIPDGFVVTSALYFQFLHENRLIPKINQQLQTINFEHPESVMQVATNIQKLILTTKISESTMREITTAYNVLCGAFKNAPITLRFSITESFTKELQQPHQAVENVHGDANLMQKIKHAWAYLFTPEALLARHDKHLDHFRNGMAVMVQKMVITKHHGTIMTIDPVTNDKTKLIVEAIAETTDHYTIISKEIVEKNIAGQKQKITDAQILTLAELGKKLEKHFYFPQEVTWAIEREHLYILQTKPLHTRPWHEKESPIALKLPLILKGIPAAGGIATGPVRLITHTKDYEKVHFGDIVIASTLATNYKSVLKKASGFITDLGGRTSHAALFAREFGIPAIVGTAHATKNFTSGQIVTINGTLGEIYKGSPSTHHPKGTVTSLAASVTTLGDIDDLHDAVNEVFLLQNIPTQNLATELIHICDSFGPRPVIYQLSDYASEEPKSVIGFRGTYRALQQLENFKRELEAIKLAKTKLQTNNLQAMVPFVRSIQELSSVKYLMTSLGLGRSRENKLWMSISVPSNVIQLDDFITSGIDGVAIDIDTLTMLLLGTDKDNSEVAHVYDPTHASVLWAVKEIIEKARKHGIASAIYGHAVAQHSSLIERVVAWGITTIVVEEKFINQTKHTLAETERRYIENRSEK